MRAHARKHNARTAPLPVEEERDADIVVLPPRSERAGAEPTISEMDEDIAEYWDLWSEQIGRALVPVLGRLSTSLPTFSSAMICTGDGFNLCSLGIDEDAVSRLSAMTSSLHSLADAVSSGVHSGDQGLETVSLTNGSSKTVLMAIQNLIIGPVLLWVTAEGDTLGTLLMRAKIAAEGVRGVLGND